MKRFAILSLFLILGCAPRESLPEVGDAFSVPPGADHLMIGSSQLSPYRKVRVGGIAYDVAVNREGKVAYVGTDDPKFTTPEGLPVGATLADVLAAGAAQPRSEPGWAYHTELPSGWSAGFVVGPEMTGGPLQPSSKVVWFFKR